MLWKTWEEDLDVVKRFDACDPIVLFIVYF